MKHKDTKMQRETIAQALYFLCALVSLCLKPVTADTAPRALPPVTEAKLRALLQAPEMQAGHIGLLITALGKAATPQAFPAVPYDNKAQPVLFAQDADKRFLPASNMKLFTSGMVLKVLGPDKTFATTVLGKIDEKTGLADLWLIGGGDPSFGDEGMLNLATQVAGSGVKTIRSITADGTLFQGESYGKRYPDGWTLDDSLWYYGPEISALAFNRNQIDVEIVGGEKSGEAATIKVSPQASVVKVLSSVTTGAEELRRLGEDDLVKVSVTNSIQSPAFLSILGQVAPRQKIELGLAVPKPNWWAAQELDRQLRARGAMQPDALSTQTGYQPDARFGLPVDLQNYKQLARHESPPVSVLLKRLLKNSDNLYAEMMLRAAAVESLKSEERTSDTNYAKRGHELIINWLKENGASTEGLKFTDGSGLSRYDMVTPRAVAGVLSAAEKLPGGVAFWNALPIAGVDGTMKNRCKDSAAQNNVRAKSGTFSIVSCLSGYVTTKDNQRLSVAILTNFVPDGRAARHFQDQVFITLAEAQWPKG